MSYRAIDGSLVDRERWGWIVEYWDGTQLHQFDDATGEYNNFGSIDQDKVSSVKMHNFSGEEYTIKIPNGARFIHYYDNIISQPLGGYPIHTRIYCFGYELNGRKTMFSILPDDSIVDGTVSA